MLILFFAFTVLLSSQSVLKSCRVWICPLLCLCPWCKYKLKMCVRKEYRTCFFTFTITWFKRNVYFCRACRFYLIYNNLRIGDSMYMKVDSGEPCISVLVEVDTNNRVLTRRPKYISIRFSSLIKSPSNCHNGNVPIRCFRPKWQTHFIPLHVFVHVLFSA
jgi:hypothetical protein